MGGVKCILPFSYLGENHDGCVRRWQDTNYWCSTRVDENGAFINSKDAWDYCDTTLCPTTTQGETLSPGANFRPLKHRVHPPLCDRFLREHLVDGIAIKGWSFDSRSAEQVPKNQS